MSPLSLTLLLLLSGEDVPANNPGEPIRGIDRLDWTVKTTIGPSSLWMGVVSAGWGTAFNHPKEYGRGFFGYAQRYGLRMSGVATSNVMEASLGTIWGEDPRYHRAGIGGFRGRLGHAAKMTVMTEHREGADFAYARLIAISGSNAISNAWRPDSQVNAPHTMYRIGLGFGGRFAGNLWDEFWPSVKPHMFWNKH